MKNLNEASAFSQKSPYEIYQDWEEIPVYKGFIIDDLLALKLGAWERTGGKAAFVNLDGAGGTCDTVVEEIPPGRQLKPVRHMYEKAVFILQGQGATTLWNEGGGENTRSNGREGVFSQRHSIPGTSISMLTGVSRRVTWRSNSGGSSSKSKV